MSTVVDYLINVVHFYFSFLNFIISKFKPIIYD